MGRITTSSFAFLLRGGRLVAGAAQRTVVRIELAVVAVVAGILDAIGAVAAVVGAVFGIMQLISGVVLVVFGVWDSLVWLFNADWRTSHFQVPLYALIVFVPSSIIGLLLFQIVDWGERAAKEARGTGAGADGKPKPAEDKPAL